jgi:hypothetical protein
MEDINNYEDAKIWECLVNFDFNNASDIPELRTRLYNLLVEKLGKCSKCTAYIPESSFCSVLKTHTGPNERCSDFEAFEEETESAFDIMSEEFQEQERVKMQEPGILKYKRNKKKEFHIGESFQ